MTIDSGTITGVVAAVGFALSYFGWNVDPQLINGAVAGVIALVAFGSALWSAYKHTQKVAVTS